MPINLKKLSFDNFHRIAFYVFLLTVPIQTRIIFLTNNTYVTNGFVEYNARFLYLSDIALIITFILYIVNYINRCNNVYYQGGQQVIHSFNTQPTKQPLVRHNFGLRLNNQIKSFISYFVNVSREAYLNRVKIVLNPVFWLVLFALWCALSISWSQFKEISFYRNLKIIEFSFLALYIAKNYFSSVNIKNSLLVLVFTANIQSLIAVAQFITQKSLGLKILGESVINPEILGVAKIFLNNEKLIRAYGTFPHPNVLGGFLVFAIVSIIILSLLNNKGTNNPNSSSKHSTLNNETFLNSNNLNKFLFASFILLNIGLFITFSRSAWLSILIVYSIVLFWINYNYISFNKIILKKILKTSVFIFLIILIVFPALYSRIDLNKIDTNSAISERLLYNNIALSMISTHPLNGVGIGASVSEIPNFSKIPLSSWQYQPAHNIYLLIFSELGLFGILIFLVLIHSLFFHKQRRHVITSTFYRILYKMLHVKHLDTSQPTSKSNYSINTNIQLLFKLSLFSFLLIGLFDHYFWTLQQGQLIFWISIGYILSSNYKTNLQNQANK